MTKRISIIIAAVLLLVVATIFVARDREGDVSDKLSVVASFYPLAHFAGEVGGEHVSVQAITPPGVEAHEYEPSPADIITMEGADMFIYNGTGFDPWASRLAVPLDKKGVMTVDMGERLKTRAEASSSIDVSDPHYWLDPVLAQELVAIIRDALIERDPARRSAYEENARLYIGKLAALDKDFSEGLRSCARRDMVAAHKAFEYLGRRYDIRVVSITGISPEEEPSAKKIAEITAIARDRGIKYVFVETIANPRFAETIAREAGIDILVLNPIESLKKSEIQAGDNYISVMTKNLNNLRKALSCV